MLHKNYNPQESESAKASPEDQPPKPEQAATGSKLPVPEEGPDRPEQGPPIPPQEQTKGIP